jgi:hypothetical protein
VRRGDGVKDRASNVSRSAGSGVRFRLILDDIIVLCSYRKILGAIVTELL